MDFYEKLQLKNEFDGSLIYGSKSFNIKTGRDKHLQNRRDRISKIIDENNVKKQSTIFQKRHCPLCSSNNYQILFKKEGFDHVRCKKCTMVYVNPILNEEKTHSFYMNEESYNKVLNNELQVNLDKKRFDYSLNLIEEITGEPGSILDIGAGPGFFLERALSKGWNATAIEMNTFSIEKLESLGIKVYNKPLEKINLNKSFDCITLWALLEHLINPDKMIKQISKILNENGVLALNVPNFDSLVVRITQEKCATFSGESHINHFNNNTLTKILDKNGFKKISIETIFSEINTIQNYLSFEKLYLGEPSYFLNILNPEYIHRNLLGYSLMGFFKKK